VLPGNRRAGADDDSAVRCTEMVTGRFTNFWR
jgi:hypothetical protein